MTSYFDDLRARVREASRTVDSDVEFLLDIEEIERGVIKDVNRVTGDREFPEDLRENIQSLIALHKTEVTTGVPTTRARERNLRTRQSVLCEKLHNVFHEVGHRRIKTRFGVLSDNPRVNCLLRANYENPVDDE